MKTLKYTKVYVSLALTFALQFFILENTIQCKHEMTHMRSIYMDVYVRVCMYAVTVGLRSKTTGKYFTLLFKIHVDLTKKLSSNLAISYFDCLPLRNRDYKKM